MTVRSRPAVSHSLNLLISICRRHQPQLNCVIAGKELFTFLIMRSINLAQFVREQICSSRTSLKSSLIPIIASAPSSYAALVPHRRASLIITDRTMRAGGWPTARANTATQECTCVCKDDLYFKSASKPLFNGTTYWSHCKLPPNGLKTCKSKQTAGCNGCCVCGLQHI